MPFLVLYILGLLLLLQNLTVITFCKMWNIRQKVILLIFYWSEPCCCLRCKLFSICKPTNTWNIKNNNHHHFTSRSCNSSNIGIFDPTPNESAMNAKKKSSDTNPALSIWQRLKPTYWAKMYYLTNTVKCLVKFTIYMQNEQKSLAYLLSIYENMLT